MKPRKQKVPDLISAELYDDEELIWWGQPIASRLALQVNYMSILISVIFAVCAVEFFIQSQNMMSSSPIGEFGSTSNNDAKSIVPLIFAIFPGIIFVGAAWSALEPLRKFVIGLRTYYLLTDQRAIIINNLQSKQVRSFYDDNITKIEVQRFDNNSGSIIFATEQIARQVRTKNRNRISISFNSDGINFNTGRRTRNVTYQVQHGFMAIHDVRTVEDLVSQVFFDNDDNKQ